MTETCRAGSDCNEAAANVKLNCPVQLSSLDKAVDACLPAACLVCPDYKIVERPTCKAGCDDHCVVTSNQCTRCSNATCTDNPWAHIPDIDIPDDTVGGDSGGVGGGGGDDEKSDVTLVIETIMNGTIVNVNGTIIYIIINGTVSLPGGVPVGTDVTDTIVGTIRDSTGAPDCQCRHRIYHRRRPP